jgi:hypothetical protein
MTTYGANITNCMNTINRVIKYFVLKQKKYVTLNDISKNNNINIKKTKLIIPFLINNKIIIKKHSKNNTITYRLNKKFNKL